MMTLHPTELEAGVDDGARVLVILGIAGDEQTLDLTEEGTIVELQWGPYFWSLLRLWRRGLTINVERIGRIHQ